MSLCTHILRPYGVGLLIALLSTAAPVAAQEGLDAAITNPLEPAPTVDPREVTSTQPPASPVANPIPLIHAPVATASLPAYDPSAWPDDAGYDGLVVPSAWLWARVGHRWDSAERAHRLADPTLWRVHPDTPKGWVMPSGTQPAGWIPTGPDACSIAQRIAFALRAHRIPLTVDERDAWERARANACPRTWQELRRATTAPTTGDDPRLWVDADAPQNPNPFPQADPVPLDTSTGPLPRTRPAAPPPPPIEPADPQAVRTLLEGAKKAP